MIVTLVEYATAIGMMAMYGWTLIGILRGDAVPQDDDQPPVSGFAS